MLGHRLKYGLLVLHNLFANPLGIGTVVTFFSGTDSALEDLEELQPSRNDKVSEKADPADVRRHVYERLTNHPRIPSECKTSFDLATVIVLSSVSALLGGNARSDEFFSRDDLDVLGRFEEYIGYWVFYSSQFS